MRALAKLGEALPRLAATSSRLAKEALLGELLRDDDVAEYVRLALDPYVRFGIAGLPEAGRYIVDDENDDDVALARLRLLAHRRRNDEISRRLVAELLSWADGAEREALRRVLLKDLRCGVHAATANKARPGLVPEFGCQLASDCPDISTLRYPVLVEPKLDGVRCLAVRDEAGVTLFSRQGIPFENFAEIAAACERLLEPGMTLDGEVVGVGGTAEAQYKGAMARARGRRGTNTHVPVRFVAFDLVRTAGDDRPLAERRRDLEAAFGGFREIGRVALSPAIQADSPADLAAFYEACVARGLEGVIVKDPEARYERKRTKAWLKLKPAKTADLAVLDYVEGIGKHAGRLGALKLEGEVGGEAVVAECGTGFSDADREAIWRLGDGLLGRVAEVRYQEITRACGSAVSSLRFPVFVRWRGDSPGEKV